MSAATRNFTSGKSHVYVLAALRCSDRGVVLKWFYYRVTRMHSADYAAARCLSVCLSVRPSHAGIECKRLYVSAIFLPSFSPTILVFPYQTGREPLNGGVECKGVWKKSRFSTNRSLYLANDARQPQLLWKANRKPHPSFRMVPVWMTLSDL